MLKRITLGVALCFGLLFSLQQSCFAQTSDELKSEREAIKSELRSKEAQERKAKFEKMTAPKPTGLSGVDELATTSTKFLTFTQAMDSTVLDLYTRTMGETIDGVEALNVVKPKTEELTKVSTDITAKMEQAANALTVASEKTPEEIKKSPLKAAAANKSLSYSKEAISLSTSELQVNLKMVNNLISTLKSSK